MERVFPSFEEHVYGSPPLYLFLWLRVSAGQRVVRGMESRFVKYGWTRLGVTRRINARSL